MAVISAGSLRNGTSFKYDNNIYKVLEFLHVKPGKGPAFVRTKIRNIVTGATVEKTFNPNEKFETIEIEKRTMQYLYNDGDMYYLMDTTTYEQMPITREDFGTALDYIKENMEVTISTYEGKIISVEPPTFVELEVEYTEPGFAGNTSTTSGKPAKLENGLEISVPLFVEIGDVLKIDTRTGEYVERVK